MKHIIALVLAALLTWAFIAVLGPILNAGARQWMSLDAHLQGIIKVVVPLLCAVPGVIILLRRRKTKPEE